MNLPLPQEQLRVLLPIAVPSSSGATLNDSGLVGERNMDTVVPVQTTQGTLDSCPFNAHLMPLLVKHALNQQQQ